MAKRSALVGKVTVTGGAKVAAFIAAAKRRPEFDVIAGVVDGSAQYPDGQTVAEVALAHEYGAPEAGTAEAAVYRNANAELIEDGTLRRAVRSGGDVARKVGELAVERYRDGFERAGLFDTGRLVRSQGYQVLPAGGADEVVEETDGDG